MQAYREHFSTAIFSFVLPYKFHAQYFTALVQFNKSHNSLAQLYNAQIQKQKNKNLRCSINQAKFFRRCISNQPNMKRLKIYSNHIVCNFLMVFNKTAFVADVENIIKYEKLQPENYQYLYLKMLTILIQKSDNYSEIREFVNKMSLIKFTTHRIFSYFYHITLQNGLLSQ